jgi:hypothetical protein
VQDTLAADVRVETERRLKALEADLGEALKNRKEKTFATRYHKIKFFGVCPLAKSVAFLFSYNKFFCRT